MRWLALVGIVLLTVVAFGCDGGESGPSVAEPSVAGTATTTARPSPTATLRPSPSGTVTPGRTPTAVASPEQTVESQNTAGATATATLAATGTSYPYPSPYVTPTPQLTPTPLPDPRRTIEGTGAPSSCFPSSPNPSEAALDLGEPTRYSRAIYSIGLDGGELTLLAERPVAPGVTTWTAPFQTYSTTPDGGALAFLAVDGPELYLATPPDSQPRLLAIFQRQPRTLAIAPGGDIVAVSSDDEMGYATALQLVQTSDGAITSITLDVRGGEPVWSPNGDWLAIAGWQGEDGQSATYVLRADGTGLRRLALGGMPLAWSPDGSRLAFAIRQWEEGDGIYVTDLEGEASKVSDSIVPQFWVPSLTWSPDGRCLAFVTMGPDWEAPPSLRVLDVETGWEVFLASDVEHPVWSPDGSRIAFLRDGNLWVMSADGSEQRQVTNPTQPFVQEPAWLPDGSGLFLAFVPTMSTSVYVMNVDGTGEVNLADGSEPSWSPDGTQVAFRGGGWAALGSSDEIYVMNSDGTGIHKIGYSFHSDALSGCWTRESYTWSPDGSFVLYCDDSEDRRGIVVAPADGGSEPELLVQSQGADWAPDGQRFAYSRYGPSGSGPQIYVKDFGAADEGRWLTEGNYPVWSPDGQRIAFVRYDSGGGGHDVYVVNVDGTAEREVIAAATLRSWSPDGSRLAVSMGYGLDVVEVASGESKRLADIARDPAWSPDGTRLAFSVWDDANGSDTSRIYIVEADGSSEPQILTDGGDPAWSPDGSRIAFAR